MKSAVLLFSVLILALSACTRSSDFVVDRRAPPVKPLETVSPGILEGVVVNYHGGLGLKDVMIEIQPLGGGPVRSVRTGARGEFHAIGLTPGMYTVSFARGDLASHANAQVFIASNRRTYYQTTMTPQQLTEVFEFNSEELSSKVDVLFVVDNSQSMMEEQALLGSALSSFIPSLGQLDWQIGVTTTDTSNGNYGIKGSLVTMDGTNLKYIDKNTPGYAEIFKETVKRDETIGCDDGLHPCPSSDERPLEAISKAVEKRSTDNAGFFREGADLAVVVLSDEDERSNGGFGSMKPEALKSAVTAAFGPSKTFSAYGILIQPGDYQCMNEQNGQGHYGTYVKALAELTGGVTGSICDDDFGPALANIGQRVLELAKNVVLQKTPVPGSVQLTIVPEDPTLTWQVAGNQIHFNKAPARGTRIEVTYIPQL